MTTLELIERGVGANCLSDAYDMGKADAIEECIEVVDKIIDACVKNGGCRNKCDEPYACVFGVNIKAEIEQLRENE